MTAPNSTDLKQRKRSEVARSNAESTTALVLSQLKFPLVFFGLALTVIEAVFGIALNRCSSENSVLVVCCMTGLFLVSIVIVAFLVWKVPTHIMLTAQAHAPEDVLEQLKRAKAAAQILRKWQEQPKTADGLLDAIEAMELILKGTSTVETGIEHA